MITYRSAISWAVHESLNMPNPELEPGKFILWSEDICGLIAAIYEKDFEDVVVDLQEELGITED